MASVFVLTGSMLPFYVPCLHRQVLMQLLGAAGVVELQVRFLALPLGLLGFEETGPAGTGFVAALPVNRTGGLTGQHVDHSFRRYQKAVRQTGRRTHPSAGRPRQGDGSMASIETYRHLLA